MRWSERPEVGTLAHNYLQVERCATAVALLANKTSPGNPMAKLKPASLSPHNPVARETGGGEQQLKDEFESLTSTFKQNLQIVAVGIHTKQKKQAVTVGAPL